MSVNAGAFTGVVTADQDAALDAASREADGFLTRRYTLPLLQFGSDLKQAVCDIAAYRILRARGFNPAKGGSDSEQLRLGYQDAMKWLGQVSDGKVTPVGIVDSQPDGGNNTDPGGELRVRPVVLSPSSGSDSTTTESSFWDPSGGLVGPGIGPPKPRGW
jgi:phage gp36-like protein